MRELVTQISRETADRILQPDAAYLKAMRILEEAEEYMKENARGLDYGETA